MAFLSPPRTPIELAVADRQVGDTLIRQRARFLGFGHAQAANGECTVTIQVLVRLYAADGAAFGPELTGPGFQPYSVALGAANDTLVDAQTGEILAVSTGLREADWQARIAELSEARDTMLQGDFFQQLRDYGLPGTINQLLAHHIQQADELGRFQ